MGGRRYQAVPPSRAEIFPDDLEQDALALERLKREAQAASSLNHPRICTIYDIDSDNGRHFIVTELLDGQTLKHRILKSAAVFAENGLDT